jgi:tetratricopeptide (TPR) repeat protein
LESVFKAFLSDHPDVVAILPTVLERGGPSGQEFVLSTAEQLETPELLKMIADFALSQNGSDKMRNRAAALAVKAKFLPKDNIRLWIEGEWRELMLIAYEFHGDPTAQHSRQVMHWLDEALDLLRTGSNSQAKDAEKLLLKALELEPDSPDLLNNLALSYFNQNRETEGYNLICDVAERFPDYVFAHAIAAKKCIEKGDFETAESLLHPFISRDRFHFLEFSSFCDAHVELLVAQKKPDVARSWLNIWEKADPENPGLEYWKLRLSLGMLKFPSK